jgi:hypothetical protein
VSYGLRFFSPERSMRPVDGVDPLLDGGVRDLFDQDADLHGVRPP